MTLCALHFFFYILQVIRNKSSRKHSSLRESEQKSCKFDRQDSDNQRFQFNVVISELLAFIVK